MNLRKLLRSWFAPRPPPPPPRPRDPRFEEDPWLAAVFAALGERYQLEPGGTRVLRRTGRARFNPMAVWIDPPARTVRAEYEVRGTGPRERVVGQADSLLDARVAPRLRDLGLTLVSQQAEDWAGTVVTRRYEGRWEEPRRAADAVRFACEDSEQQLNLAAEVSVT